MLEEALRSFSEGEFERALEHYRRLERDRPDEGTWSRRVANTYSNLGKRVEAAAARYRAAEKYEREGLLEKARAMCRLIIESDSGSLFARELLQRLEGRRRPGLARGTDETAGQAPREVRDLLAAYVLDVEFRPPGQERPAPAVRVDQSPTTYSLKFRPPKKKPR